MTTEILKQSEIAQQFDQFPARINSFRLDAGLIQIENEDSLLVAKSKLDQGKTLVDNIEKVRKTFKEPYFKITKEIDAYAKMISEPLHKEMEQLKNKTKSYIEIKAAQARAEAIKESKIIDEKKNLIDDELAFLDRVTKQVQARLFGGKFTNAKNEKFSSFGCQQVDDCDNLQDFIANSFPDPKKYNYIGEALEKLKMSTLVNIAKVRLTLIEKNPDKFQIIKNADIEKAKTEAEVIKNTYTKEIKKEEKGVESLQAEARKGLVKKLTFVVTDESKVSKQFWSIDEAKIKAYLSEHREEIYKGVEKGEEILPGIEFTIENTYSNR